MCNNVPLGRRRNVFMYATGMLEPFWRQFVVVVVVFVFSFFISDSAMSANL